MLWISWHYSKKWYHRCKSFQIPRNSHKLAKMGLKVVSQRAKVQWNKSVWAVASKCLAWIRRILKLKSQVSSKSWSPERTQTKLKSTINSISHITLNLWLRLKTRVPKLTSMSRIWAETQPTETSMSQINLLQCKEAVQLLMVEWGICSTFLMDCPQIWRASVRAEEGHRYKHRRNRGLSHLWPQGRNAQF